MILFSTKKIRFDVRSSMLKKGKAIGNGPAIGKDQENIRQAQRHSSPEGMLRAPWGATRPERLVDFE